jgi:multidrug efflux pump subunit AcrA (membrane-fusion protein)
MTSVSAGSGLLFVEQGQDWQVRRAEFGSMAGGWVEVLSGVAPGERVIVEGQQVLASGDRIRDFPWQAP